MHNTSNIQSLLASMRANFIDELPERLNNIENHILTLEKNTSTEIFNELYRAIHSLKGTGGSFGINIITRISHQMENILSESKSNSENNAAKTALLLSLLDLLRQAQTEATAHEPNYEPIDDALLRLQQQLIGAQKNILLLEPSTSLRMLYQQVLLALPAKIHTLDDGLHALEHLAHERFDLLITARELKRLNGIALLAALRAADNHNSHIPALLISSAALTINDTLTTTLLRSTLSPEELIELTRKIVLSAWL
jgi:CheY-like chemotaxis protein